MELNNLKKVENIISKVYKNSIASELGIEEGDILVSINEQEIEDIIEYKYLISDDYVEVEIKKKNSDIYIYEIDKEYDEDLGIEFLNPIIDKAKSCKNKCVFCFIDQLPKGMRETLYFKDDDSRLSFLQGNFITLTNMSENDIKKMVQYRISPVNISVHTTNPQLRRKMLSNKNAGKVYDIMKRLSDVGIEMNCQIVLCKDLNDKQELTKTVNDLYMLYPHVKSVAIVPVGLSKHRDGLYDLKMFDKQSSINVINQIHKLQETFFNEIGTRFVFLSDEFYIMAQTSIPSFDSYEGFAQIENGVGLISKFENEIKQNIKKQTHLNQKRRVSIATGASAYKFINNMANDIMDKINNIQIDVYEIRNDYFGEMITVAGLLTATDLIKNLSGKDLGDELLITRAMLKADEEIFLDNITLKELSDILKIKITPCKVNGKDFLDKVLNGKEN